MATQQTVPSLSIWSVLAVVPSGAVPFLPATAASMTTLITSTTMARARVMRKAGVVTSLRSSALVRRAMAVARRAGRG